MDVLVQSIKNIRDEIKNKDDKMYTNLTNNPNVDKSTLVQTIKQLASQNAPLYKCRDTITTLLYIIYQDTKFTNQEANEIFFCLTQLFTKKDPILKRLLHISIKELAHMSNDAIIATSSLIKDINTDDDFYKPSAMRALVRVTDKSMIGSIERYLKQAIVYKYKPYASASLVSSYNINNPDLLKKWTSEITEALESDCPFVQYHALGVVYLMRQDDRHALIKMISKYGQSIDTPMAVIFMIRVCTSLLLGLSSNGTLPVTLGNTPDLMNSSDNMKILFGFLSTCLNTRNDMIGLEACRACIALKSLPTKIVQLILNIFKIQFSSYKNCVRFAAIRSLYDMIIKHSYLIDTISKEIKDQVEFLTNDENKNICVYAVILSLKLANQENMKRTLKLSSELIKELADEFRVEIIRHMAVIASKYNEHGDVLLKIFNDCIRNEGGYEFKSSLVSSILVLLRSNTNMQKACLHSLCEYLEDCEYPRLSIKIIRHIGIHIRSCSNPTTCVRYIFNRILLEKSEIRLAAVRCLAHIACQYRLLSHDIVVLLQRCLEDPNDNIRMEADLYCRLLTNDHYTEFVNNYLLTSSKSTIYDMKHLKNAVSLYLLDGNFKEAFNVDAYHITTDNVSPPTNTDSQPYVEKIEKAINDDDNYDSQPYTTEHVNRGNISNSISEKEKLEIVQQSLITIDLFKPLGTLLSMSKHPFNLTEAESEYIVKANKFIFADHVVIEFSIKNTVKDIAIDNVRFEFTPPDEFVIISQSLSPKINYNDTGMCYSVLKLPFDPLNLTGYCRDCVMKFNVIDSISHASYDDHYEIEDIPIVIEDYITALETFSFDAEWNSIGADHELSDGFLLSTVHTIDDAIDKVTELLGLNVVKDSVITSTNDSTSKRVVQMFGAFKLNQQVACILEFSKFPNIDGVAVNAIFRSNDPVACEVLVSSLYT